MEETIENLKLMKRHLNSIEHMIYVSCKFTRNSEMLRRVMETIITGYEHFFGVAYGHFSEEESSNSLHHKIEFLTDLLSNKGVSVDMSDYFLLKRLLISEFDTVGEYRKNLSIVSYVDGEEYTINLSKLLNFYEKLKGVCQSLNNVLNENSNLNVQVI